MKLIVILCLVGFAASDKGYAPAEPPPRSGYEAPPSPGYKAPAPGYGPPQTKTVATRTETVQSPGATIEWQSQWQAPVYQRLVSKASNQQGYAPPEPQAGYGPPEQGYGPPATSPPVQQGESKTFVKFQQEIQAGTGTVSRDAAGEVVEESYADTPSNYRYSYGVEDLTGGDVKMVQEQRTGDQVVGSYSFMQPDGCQRTVYYMTDAVWGGLKAVVEYKGVGCAERYELPPAQ